MYSQIRLIDSSITISPSVSSSATFERLGLENTEGKNFIADYMKG
jgi:hypothetical protein